MDSVDNAMPASSTVQTPTESNQAPTADKTSQQELANSAKQANSSLDPMLRKLEQVESARDPSALLRAQFILQAQRKPQPTDTDQPW